MADYIYTLELRLTPNQQKGITLVQDISRAAGMNVYLTGGAVRDLISGFPIRDLDSTFRATPSSCSGNLSALAVASEASKTTPTRFMSLCPAAFVPKSAAREQSAMRRPASLRSWRLPPSSKTFAVAISP